MRFSLSVATVLAAAGLISATPLEARRGELGILAPTNEATIGSPFKFQYIDNLRSESDTSYVQVGLWNLTYRGVLGTVAWDKDNYTTATAEVTVPALYDDLGYALIAQQFDSGGNQLNMGYVYITLKR